MGKRNKKKTIPNDFSDRPPTLPVDDDDDTLVDDLLAELESRDAPLNQSPNGDTEDKDVITPQVEETKTKKDSKARFRAREMRRVANRLASLPTSDETNSQKIIEETAAEEKTIRTICDQQGLRIHEINPDGHCLFAAVADQLNLLSILPPAGATYETTRKTAADYIHSHPDDFLPFLVSLTDVNSDEPMTLEELDKYCDMIRSTATWGGEPEITALSRAYNIPIHVIQGEKPSLVVHSPGNSDTNSPGSAVRISYHRRMYGLGEVSLRLEYKSQVD
ncbi:hypothetical protein Clacol_006407 [Clathrus columnatus]|uniref:OTU domain-containing protein n=1 Tax=Clathrus columnatus TaxID=1419009 RepID=A0AAV5ABZ5_9AGAM|nr:hypothetical protein Clacol_006407 [Clathrus columnatus]